MPHKKHKSPPANTRKGIQAVKSQFSAPPLSGVTPHIVGRCHEVTEGTATVSGCLRSRLRGSQKKTLLKHFLSLRHGKAVPPPSSEGGKVKLIDTLRIPRQREARLS